MPMDFPNSPTANQVFSIDNRSWKWTGARWELVEYPGIIGAETPLVFNEETKIVSLDDSNIESLNDSVVMNIMGAH
jgi:hypothetical protein